MAIISKAVQRTNNIVFLASLFLMLMGILSKYDLLFRSTRVNINPEHTVPNTIKTRTPKKEKACDNEYLSTIESARSIGFQHKIPQISNT